MLAPMTYTIAALYQFVDIKDIAALRVTLKAAFAPLGIYGTLLIAPEGINGTLAGSDAGIDAMLNILNQHTGLKRDEVKFSYAKTNPFRRLKLRLKKEIVTFKQPQIDPVGMVGTYVSAEEWNTLMAQDDVLVLDTRNLYETRIGTFDGAVVPPIRTFTEFADYVRKELNTQKNKKIAMFCTGGIRCEKASAFMRSEGFEDVFHLKGGILKYLETVPQNESRWNGDCYVFDGRVAVGHGLTSGHYAMCDNCGGALRREEMNRPCPECNAVNTHKMGTADVKEHVPPAF